MESTSENRWSYRPLDDELRHFRIVSEKYRELQGELVRSLVTEQQSRRQLEARLQQALEGERLEREKARAVLVSAQDFVRLDNIAVTLREENERLREEIQEIKAQTEVEAGVTAAKTAAWEERVREASRLVEQEQQAAKEVARQACEQAEQRAQLDKQAQREVYEKQAEAARRAHHEELEALRAEIQAIRNECNEQVNVAALEFEERSAQLTDCISALESEKTALESEKTALRDQLSRCNSRASLLQSRLDESQRALEREKTRVLEANRTILALRQNQQPQFQPASSLYPPLPLERRRQSGTEPGLCPSATAPAPAPPSKPCPQRRVRRKAFESNLPPQPEPVRPLPPPPPPPSLFTFKRRHAPSQNNPPVPHVTVTHQPPTPTTSSSFLRHLSMLPAHKQTWSMPPEPQTRPRNGTMPPDRPALYSAPRDPGEDLEATRRFFGGRSRESLLTWSDLGEPVRDKTPPTPTTLSGDGDIVCDASARGADANNYEGSRAAEGPEASSSEATGEECPADLFADESSLEPSGVTECSGAGAGGGGPGEEEVAPSPLVPAGDSPHHTDPEPHQHPLMGDVPTQVSHCCQEDQAADGVKSDSKPATPSRVVVPGQLEEELSADAPGPGDNLSTTPPPPQQEEQRGGNMRNSCLLLTQAVADTIVQLEPEMELEAQTEPSKKKGKKRKLLPLLGGNIEDDIPLLDSDNIQ